VTSLTQSINISGLYPDGITVILQHINLRERNQNSNLPLNRTLDRDMVKTVAKPSPKTNADPAKETLMRVLHVDDDDDFLIISKRLLELQCSFQVESVLSVKEALQKIRQKSYDVIVSDYQMPETNGLNFLKELRDRGNDIPFILFTGKGREEIAIDALNLGADRYFNKSGKPKTVYGELAHSLITAVKAKRAEKALQESEEKYHKQFEKALDAIVLADAETGIILDCNRAATELVGRKKSEMVGKHQRILHPPEPIEGEFSRTFKQHLKEKEGQVLETQVIKKTGEIRDVAIKANIIELGNKRLIQGAFRDITEQKKAEEKLDEMMNELVTINEKLGVIGKLTRHDARNKLSVIANNAYLAKQKLAADHTALEYLGDIESAVDQMEEIFDFARTYEMLGVEELSYMNVEKSVNEAAILFSGLASVKLTNECQGLTVMADSLLRQLFYNLIDDTLKHGEKVSQIRVYYEEGEDQLKLIYEDDGIGIPNYEKEKIFKEGYGKGTGYGLYLITKICETYGWTIRETGVPGKGAQFTMTIPKTNKKGIIPYRFDNE